MEDIIKPQVKHSIKMFNYWFWNCQDNCNHVLQLRHVDDFEIMINMFNGLKDIEQAKEISYKEYKDEVCQTKEVFEELLLIIAK